MIRTCSPVAPRLLARQAAGSRRTFLSLSNDVQTYRIKRVVRNRPDVLYNVVADVKSYEQFIPYCEKSEITERNAAGVPQRASLEVGWNQFSETFESKLQFDEHTVIVSTLSTPSLLNLTLPGRSIQQPDVQDALHQVDSETAAFAPRPQLRGF